MRAGIKAFCLAATLCCSALAAAKDNKAEARALVERNRSLTNIRSSGSPSFKLQATFVYRGAKSGAVEGSYELHWASPQQWKETFQAGDARVTRVFTQGALSRSSEGLFPAPENEISDLFLAPVEVHSEDPSGIQKTATTTVKCVNMNYVPFDCPGCQGVFGSLARIACFDAGTGLLQQLQVLTGSKKELWDYSNYQPFEGSKSIPGILKRQTIDGDYFEAQLVSANTATFPASEFEPLAAPSPRAACDTSAPRPLKNPDPDYSQEALGGRRDIRAIFSVLLGADGVPVSATTVKSGGEVFDREAIRTLMRWRFAPATCKGQKVPVSISVELNSHI
jgi:TonB family protein